MKSRAILSTSVPLAPARIPAMARSLASTTRIENLLEGSFGFPKTRVRVVSEQYSFSRAPQSISRGSPFTIRRSEGMAWGRALLGPEAAITGKERPWAPNSRMFFSRFQATCFSVIPGRIVRHQTGKGLFGQTEGVDRSLDLLIGLGFAQVLHQIFSWDQLYRR